MTRKLNDGGATGIKQDRFRNSRFEYDHYQEPERPFGVTRKNNNTIGSPWQENHGRRNSSEDRSRWDSSPFENGKEYNWNYRQGWDQYYRPYDRGNRPYGRAQIDHEVSHIGKGPRGYTRSDIAIFEDVCDTLSLSAEVDASEIEVNVKEGIVFLRGSVPDRRMKKMAELEIENISGIKDVQNYLILVSKKQEEGKEKDMH